MAVDPIKIQTVLRKASDQQLMALLKRPDSIPSMFVQQEIRRRNQARQAAKADMSKMAMAQRPQLTPEMSRMDQPPMPRPQDPMASAIPMNKGGSGELAKQKQLLLQMYNAGRLNIVQGVAQNDQGELGEFARGLISANQMRPTDNKGLNISRKPQFTDFDMTNPRNNFPGSRLNYSVAPMIQESTANNDGASASVKSEFMEQLENAGIKAIQSETTPMDLENEFIEGQFNPEGKFDYGVEQGYKPFMPNVAGRESIYIDTPLNTFPFRERKDMGASRGYDGVEVMEGATDDSLFTNKNQRFTPEMMNLAAENQRAMKKNTSDAENVDPRMRTNTIGFDPRTNIGEMRFPPNYVERRTPSPFVSKGGVRSMEDKALPLSDTGIPLLQEHMKNLEAQLKAQGEDMSEYNITSNFKPNVPTMDDLKKLIPTTEQLEFAYEKGPGIVLDKAKGILTNPYYDKAIKGIYYPFAKLGGMDQETYNEVTDAALKDTFSNMNKVLNRYADKRGIQTLVGSEANQVTPGSGYTVINKGSPNLAEPTTGKNEYDQSDRKDVVFDFVKNEKEKDTIAKADENTTDNVVDYTKPFTDKANMDNAFMDKDGKPLSAGDALKKQYQNLKESEAVNNDGKKTGGVGGAIASQYGKLTDAQNKLIEAMKPNGGDRFWQLVAEFGANLAASDSPNFMQAAGQAMQQTLAEAKDMKKEDRQMLIDQAKVAVDLEFKRAELGLQLARINASGSRTTNADAIRQANYNLAIDKFAYMMKRDASEDEQKNLKIFTDIVNGIDPNTMKVEDYNQRVQTIADNLQVPNIYATGTQQKDTKEIRE